VAPKIIRWFAVSAFGMLGLTGCVGLDQRTGPNPVIDGAAAYNATGNKALLLTALARDAGYRDGELVDYYNVAEAGFNYVDDQCRDYFDQLFFLNRGREQAKSGIAAAGQTTAAILGVTGATTASLAIVAQAFGLASATTDIVAGTYLYALPPATTQGFVERRQAAFRDAAAQNRARINTPSSAYYFIQRYLNLCLPPSIEAEITKQISATTVVPVSTGGSGALFTLETISEPTMPVGRPVVRPSAPPAGSLVSRPAAEPARRFVGPGPVARDEARRERVSKVVETVPVAPASRPKDLDTFFIRQVQAALCVSPADGSLGDPTRRAIQTYLQALRQKAPPTIDPTDPVLKPRLLDAVDDVGDCQSRGFENAYEVGRFGVPSDKSASRIMTLQRNLSELLKSKGSATKVEQSGKFDQPTRAAIAEIRGLTGTSGDQIDAALDVMLH
jgi:hypothetical protein